MFASLLVIVLYNSYFLLLATVLADATVYAKKKNFLPPIIFASFKGFVLVNYYSYIKNHYFNSAFKLQLKKIVYNRGAVNSAFKGYQKQKKGLLNSFYCELFVALYSLSELVYPFKP